MHGALNEMPPEGFDVLDVWEGVAGGHYERRVVAVVRADTGETIEAVTYVALLVGHGLRPTRDYLGHLLAGRDLLPAIWEQSRHRWTEIPLRRLLDRWQPKRLIDLVDRGE